MASVEAVKYKLTLHNPTYAWSKASQVTLA